MIRSIRPGKLRNKSDSEIAASLSALMGCDVECILPDVYIYCVTQYSSLRSLYADMQQLKHLGQVVVGASAHSDAYVKLTFNQKALEVLRGEETKNQEEMK